MQFLYLLSREGEAGRPPKISCPQYAGNCSSHSAIGKRIVQLTLTGVSTH